MAQKTNLNVNPYFDDFDSTKNFYKVLFNPAKPVQSRELNTIQSILQNQIESFGSHIFKEGSMVIPGGVSYDSEYCAVKLNSTSFGVDISLYIEKYVGQIIRGEVSGISAIVKEVVFPNSSGVENITIYVKYLDSDNSFNQSVFSDGESLLSTQPVSYGINNVLISDGTPFASLISDNATVLGSSVSIDNGIYFVRGTFVNVNKQTLILDYYNNISSYRVGLRVSENIITTKEDESLFDNAKGFTNFVAPGADRLKINLSLTKKSLSDINDTDFIELLRVENGFLKRIENKTDYNLIKDYLAQRTYDESGNYTVTPFNISINNSLNNLLGNNGIYFDGNTTTGGNTPSDDLMCVTISPGKAYVKGYDVEKTSTTILDIEKPRDTQTVTGALVPFKMGNILRINNIYGAPVNRSTVYFYSRRRNGATSTPGGVELGSARIYLCKLTDAAYEGARTKWDLYLYDIQFYTHLTLNNSLTATELPAGSIITGNSSGATGYVVSAGTSNNLAVVRQTSGTFLVNENISINGITLQSRSILGVRSYKSSDIKSVYSSGSPAFLADSVLESFIPVGFSGQDQITIGSDGVVRTANKPFSGISTDTIVKYSRVGFSTETYNSVTNVSADGTTFTLSSVSSVSNVNNGDITDSNLQSRFIVGNSVIRDQNSGYLYSVLPNTNISSIDLSNSQLTFSAQSVSSNTISGGSLTLSTGDFTLPGNSGSIKFDTFDAEKYSIHYDDGTIESLTDDQVTFNPEYTQITFNGITNGKTTYIVNGTFVKTGIQSKTKVHKKSTLVNVELSKYEQSGSNSGSSINDGLTFNRYYGLRVQDNEICLRYPDVIRVLAVYESLDSSLPTFDRLNFSSLYGVYNNSIVGENITGKTSNSIARIVKKDPLYPNSVEIVYLNGNKFQVGEEVSFEQSNITSPIESVSFGRYKNITNIFKLDKGQKNQYYDYSKIIRNSNEQEPTKKLTIVIDHYDVSSTDSGDLFSILSYNDENYGKDIPNIGFLNIRSSDTLDFRPRVSYFSGSSSSPFDFSSRNFGNGPKVIFTPNESSLVNYNFYLGRIDKVYLDSYGSFVVEKGISSTNPKEPYKSGDLLEIASISLPPYLYDTSDAKVSLVDNRRYTMRDIGKIEDRVENLEVVTSLSLLELDTQTLQIQDADGINRFKTGFFADSFRNDNFIDLGNSLAEISDNNELTPLISKNSLKNQIIPLANSADYELDLSQNFELLDNRVKKTGQVITLDYESVDWIEQPLATRVENVNPFHVIQYVGDVRLNPFRDTWIRTVELPDRVITHNNSLNLESKVNTERITLNNVDNTTGTGSGGLGVGQVRDTWTELSLSDGTVSQETFTSSDSGTSRSTERSFIESEFDTFMRSRNTEFSVSNLRAFTQYYSFLDGISTIDFTPKLIEVTSDVQLQNPGTDGSFTVGENIVGFDNGVPIITFRLAQPNHKSGPFNNPSKTYDVNPYSKSEILPTAYSESSTVLNIDTFSLSEEAQGLYSGYLVRRAILIGETSGAAAYVKDLRLITDNYGDLIGTFFIRDPNTLPPPVIRVPTGNKTFKLSSSQINENGLLNGTDISSAETSYLSEGTVQTYQNIIRIHTINASLTTTNNIRTRTLNAVRNENISTINLPEPVVNVTQNITQNITQNVTQNITQNITNVTRILQQQRHADPLAQTFLVGSSRGLNSFNDDINGAFLTSVDLFFAKKDPGNATVTVQIRTVEFGTPTLTIIGDPVTLRPNDIQTSTDGSVATKVTFPYPIFLPPGLEYAIVILAPQSDQYELWVARMGETTVNTLNLPDVESVRYTKQFAIGSLFKSQNGSIWTDDQYEDLKFKLYKAKFNSLNGIAYFQNPTLSKSNGYVRNLINNPITTLPRKLKVGITTVYDSTQVDTILTVGRKVGETSKTFIYGNIVGTGCSVSSVAISTGGRNYSVGISTVETFNVTGNGSGLKLEVTAGSNGTITSTTINQPGNGYSIGDVVGIVTSNITGSSNLSKGQNALITITGNNDAIDTLYLSGVQGNTFTNGSAELVYYNDSNTRVTLGSTIIQSSETYGSYSEGNYMKVNHFNHGMYAANNIVELSGITPDTPGVILSSQLLRTDSTLNIPSVDATYFQTFEGSAVSASNPGYLIINNEIIKYTTVQSSSLEGLERGIDNTIAINHPENSIIRKYELSGVSLRRINKTHNIVDSGIELDSYYLEIDKDGLDGSNNFGYDRSSDADPYPMLSFNSEKNVGGSTAYASENIIYDTTIPFYNTIIPGATTEVTAQMRTITGTSANGNEISFTDLGYENVQINQANKLNSIRMISSKVNSDEYLDALPRNKSLITALTLSSDNYNLSPMVFLDDTFIEFHNARLNNPVSNYVNDGRVNGLTDDPHAAIYVSRTIRLSQPSNSLRVLLSAYKHPSSDFRVLYSLVRPESNESLPSFNLFPGYNNLTIDNNLDGYFDVVDESKNSGLSDTFVPSSLENQFLEYQYTAANVGPFIGFTIKIVMSGTRQDKYPRFRDLRAIALA
jgi:hypothetical protein